MVEEKLEYPVFALGDFQLQGGITLPDAKLAYQTYGQLSDAKDNAILNPTWFTGQHFDSEWLIKNGGLDASKYFIIVPDMFGNGLSSSPSNTPPPFHKGRFPQVTVLDNIRAQRRLLEEKFGISKLKLVCGWSMGAMQTYAWASYFPDMVERALPWMGSARCSEHNFVFLEGVKAAMTADVAFQSGMYKEPPEKGICAAARVYAGWGLSQSWYRERLYIKQGFSSLEDYLVRFWENRFLHCDANNFLCMLNTWQNGDIANNEKYNGDFELALKSITAKMILVPCKHDLYFPPEDTEIEHQHIPNSEYHPSPSIWGHQAGGPACTSDDAQVIKDHIERILAT